MSRPFYLAEALHARVSRGKAAAGEPDTVPVEHPETRDGDLPPRFVRRRQHPNKMAQPGTVRGYATK